MKKLLFVVGLLASVTLPVLAAEEKPEAPADKVHFRNILTMRDFIILVMFPDWDQVLRVDCGNKNLFGAEASKDYPNFVVLFQKVSSAEVKRPLRTNVTVLLRSGHVFHFLLNSLDNEKAKPEKIPLLYNFTREYDDGKSAAQTVALEKPAPGLSEMEKALLERLAHLEAKFDQVTEARAMAQAKEKMFDWMEGDATSVVRRETEHGLEVTLHEVRKVDRLSVVRFSVTNRSSSTVEILEPQVTLETIRGKKTLRTRTVSVDKLRLTATRIEPKGTTRGVLAFPSDGERDANQVFKLVIVQKDAADKPVKVTLF